MHGNYNFAQKLFLVCGDNLSEASEFLGISQATIYRWLDNPDTAHPCAVRLLDVALRGYLPNHKPFSEWKINKNHIVTPFGKVCPYDVEFLPIYKQQLGRADISVSKLKRQRQELRDNLDLDKLEVLQQTISLLTQKLSD